MNLLRHSTWKIHIHEDTDSDSTGVDRIDSPIIRLKAVLWLHGGWWSVPERRQILWVNAKETRNRSVLRLSSDGYRWKLQRWLFRWCKSYYTWEMGGKLKYQVEYQEYNKILHTYNCIQLLPWLWNGYEWIRMDAESCWDIETVVVFFLEMTVLSVKDCCWTAN